MEIGASGAFIRYENIIVFEARSILCAVQYAESCYPQLRLLVLSDNLALMLALWKGRSTFFFTMRSVMRRISALWLQGRV